MYPIPRQVYRLPPSPPPIPCPEATGFFRMRAPSTRICLAARRTLASSPFPSRPPSFPFPFAAAAAIRNIHISSPQPAQVAPGLVSSVPPPPPAAPSAYEPRPSRRQRQKDLLRPPKPASTSGGSTNPTGKRRFWETVSVAESPSSPGNLEIRLDSRKVRHPVTKLPILIPRSRELLAHALAVEWDSLLSSLEAAKQHLIPLTSLVCRAIDIAEDDEKNRAQNKAGGRIREGIVATLLRYLDTDTILCMAARGSSENGEGNHDGNDPNNYRNDDGKTLRDLQEEKFEEVVGPLTARTWPGVKVVRVLGDEGNSIFPRKQEPGTREVVQGWLLGLDAWDLAGVERATLAGKSLLTAVRLVEEWRLGGQGEAKFGVEEAARAVSVETDWQQARWGEVEDTHDVEREDVRRQFGSVVLLVSGGKADE
ncbi:putative mitochondrial protein atp12 precursor [Cladorrhinum samala]|uniref:Mitochondrial protein atp12 n=1 Tax=Cladorrhinum samala TaxID=585594 RepID=A0AAV9H6T8_9PEZI|nr:putative mitochondrial protein atp12 precursor [Cladorrhinum samala]